MDNLGVGVHEAQDLVEVISVSVLLANDEDELIHRQRSEILPHVLAERLATNFDDAFAVGVAALAKRFVPTCHRYHDRHGIPLSAQRICWRMAGRVTSSTP